MAETEEKGLRKIAYFFVDEDPYHPPKEFRAAPSPKTNITAEAYELARELLRNKDLFVLLGRFRNASYGPQFETLAKNATLVRTVNQNPEMDNVKIYARFFSIAGFDMESIKETAEKLKLPLEELVD